MTQTNQPRTFEFKVDYDTQGVIYEPVGRMYLADGSHVRIVFSPHGLLMFVDQKAIDNKALIITHYEDHILFGGLGRMPEKPEGGSYNQEE